MIKWAMRKELIPLFPENKVIHAIKFAVKVIPVIAVASILMQMAFNNYSGLPQAMTIALFALSIPLQGIWWLGIRRDTLLPPTLISWYRELHKNIMSKGEAIQPIRSRSRYQELAKILNYAFKQLDKSSLEYLFRT